MEDKPLDDITKKQLEEIEPRAPFPEQEIRASIEATIAGRQAAALDATPARGLHPGWKAALAVAASLLFFLAGVEYGRRISSGAAPAAPSIPVAIQAEGTEYIATLARLTEVRQSLTPEEREQARQVALAVLYGAALELMRYAPEDRVAATVFESVAAGRWGEERGEEAEGKTEVYRF